MFDTAHRTLTTALEAFRTDDKELALQACRLEDEMDRVAVATRQGHMNRANSGQCDPEAGVLFVETLRNLERIGDHADNVALTLLRRS